MLRYGAPSKVSAVPRHRLQTSRLAAPVYTRLSTAAAFTTETGPQSSAPTPSSKTFDRKLAVVLAQCAFEAYADVTDECTKAQTPNGCSMAFTNEELLLSKGERLLQQNSDDGDDASSVSQEKCKIGKPAQRKETEWWREVIQLAGLAAEDYFEPIAFLECSKTSTEVWVLLNKPFKKVCLAFRGTVHDKWKDILTDISMTPVKLDPNKVKESSPEDALAEISQDAGPLEKVLAEFETAQAELKEKQESGDEDGTGIIEQVQQTADNLSDILSRIKKVIDDASDEQEEIKLQDDEHWVHSGFLTAYDSVRADIHALVDALLEDEKEPWTIYLTGHSLGGALATLCSFDLALSTWKYPKPHLIMYNYGSPRVGNKRFARKFNELVPNAYRIVNGLDAVCTVPRLLGYCHVGHAAILNEGKVEVQKNTTESPSEGAVATDVLPVWKEGFKETIKNAIPEIASDLMEKIGLEILDEEEDDLVGDAHELWEHEKKAWSALLEGSVDHHMEDLYVKSVKSLL